MLITELFDLTEVKIDNQNGAGATPDNANIDYKGLRVLMRPSVFLKLAAPLNMPHSEKLEAYIAQGGAIASPMLTVDIPEAWEQGDFQPLAQVTDHEGRNRASVILKLEGDEPIEVHLFPRYFRHRHITDQWIEALNRGLHVQGSQQVLRGPLFSPQLVDEGWREKTAAAMAAATMGWGAYNAANQPPPGVEPVATAAPIAQHRANEPQFTDRIPLRDVLVRRAREAGIQGQELLHLIAQAAHETANWRHMEEQPPQGARNPQKYFSKKYDNRKILANKRPGDGYRYRGRGYLQLTGLDNYTRAGRALGLDLVNHPEEASDPDTAARIAVWFWKNRVSPRVADWSQASVRDVTRGINRKQRGAAQRAAQFQRISQPR